MRVVFLVSFLVFGLLPTLAFAQKPRAIILSIGVEQYVPKELNELKYVAEDAIRVVEMLSKYVDFDEERSKIVIADREWQGDEPLPSHAAGIKVTNHRMLTADHISKAIKDFMVGADGETPDPAAPDELIYLYLGGHGDVIEKEKDKGVAFLPSNPDFDDAFSVFLVSDIDLIHDRSGKDSNKVIALLNMCRSGALPKNAQGAVERLTEEQVRELLYENVRAKNNRFFVPASLPKQNTYEWPEKGSSLFVEALQNTFRSGSLTSIDPEITLASFWRTYPRELGDVQAEYKASNPRIEIATPDFQSALPDDADKITIGYGAGVQAKEKAFVAEALAALAYDESGITKKELQRLAAMQFRWAARSVAEDEIRNSYYAALHWHAIGETKLSADAMEAAIDAGFEHSEGLQGPGIPIPFSIINVSHDVSSNEASQIIEIATNRFDQIEPKEIFNINDFGGQFWDDNIETELSQILLSEDTDHIIFVFESFEWPWVAKFLDLPAEISSKITLLFASEISINSIPNGTIDEWIPELMSRFNGSMFYAHNVPAKAKFGVGIDAIDVRYPLEYAFFDWLENRRRFNVTTKSILGKTSDTSEMYRWQADSSNDPVYYWKTSSGMDSHPFFGPSDLTSQLTTFAWWSYDLADATDRPLKLSIDELSVLQSAAEGADVAGGKFKLKPDSTRKELIEQIFGGRWSRFRFNLLKAAQTEADGDRDAAFAMIDTAQNELSKSAATDERAFPFDHSSAEEDWQHRLIALAKMRQESNATKGTLRPLFLSATEFEDYRIPDLAPPWLGPCELRVALIERDFIEEKQDDEPCKSSDVIVSVHTRSALQEHLKTLVEQSEPADLLLVSFHGRGYIEKGEPQLLLSSSAPAVLPNRRRPPGLTTVVAEGLESETSISVKSVLNALEGRNAIIILDAQFVPPSYEVWTVLHRSAWLNPRAVPPEDFRPAMPQSGSSVIIWPAGEVGPIPGLDTPAPSTFLSVLIDRIRWIDGGTYEYVFEEKENFIEVASASINVTGPGHRLAFTPGHDLDGLDEILTMRDRMAANANLALETGLQYDVRDDDPAGLLSRAALLCVGWQRTTDTSSEFVKRNRKHALNEVRQLAAKLGSDLVREAALSERDDAHLFQSYAYWIGSLYDDCLNDPREALEIHETLLGDPRFDTRVANMTINLAQSTADTTVRQTMEKLLSGLEDHIDESNVYEQTASKVRLILESVNLDDVDAGQPKYNDPYSPSTYYEPYLPPARNYYEERFGAQRYIR